MTKEKKTWFVSGNTYDAQGVLRGGFHFILEGARDADDAFDKAKKKNEDEYPDMQIQIVSFNRCD